MPLQLPQLSFSVDELRDFVLRPQLLAFTSTSKLLYCYTVLVNTGAATTSDGTVITTDGSLGSAFLDAVAAQIDHRIPVPDPY